MSILKYWYTQVRTRYHLFMKKCCLLISQRYLSVRMRSSSMRQRFSKSAHLRRFLKNHYQPLSWTIRLRPGSMTNGSGNWMKKSFFHTGRDKPTGRLQNKTWWRTAGQGWNFTRSSTLFRLALPGPTVWCRPFFPNHSDFSKPDNIVWSCADYAANTTELALRWQRLFKWRILEDIADKLTGDGKTLPLQQPVDFGKWEKEMREKLKKREGNTSRACSKHRHRSSRIGRMNTWTALPGVTTRIPLIWIWRRKNSRNRYERWNTAPGSTWKKMRKGIKWSVTCNPRQRLAQRL